jgi:hypothetical protein
MRIHRGSNSNNQAVRQIQTLNSRVYTVGVLIMGTLVGMGQKVAATTRKDMGINKSDVMIREDVVTQAVATEVIETEAAVISMAMTTMVAASTIGDALRIIEG